MKKRSTKFLVAGGAIVLAIGFLIYNSVGQYSGFYMEVGELVARGESAYGQQVRLNGKVLAKSIDYDPGIPKLEFKITDADGKNEIPVVYNDLAPDTFKDGADVVVEGAYQKNGVFEADTLLAKCPSKYEAEAEGEGKGSEGESY
ncbi:MAG: cytochrome c maturation protein CcmE [Terriglobia bacterium]